MTDKDARNQRIADAITDYMTRRGRRPPIDWAARYRLRRYRRPRERASNDEVLRQSEGTA